MSIIPNDIEKKVSSLIGGWATYVALGSFLLYLFGYLSLRFHLTALGIATDLTVIDQRYFYAGAKFVVYILLYIPLIVLLILIVSILSLAPLAFAAGLVIGYRRIRKRRSKAGAQAPSQGLIKKQIRSWLTKPWIIALLGILVSEVSIQFLMRQCLELNDALLNPSVASDSWVGTLMKGETNIWEVFYFSAIVACTAVVGGLLLLALRLRKDLATKALLHDDEVKSTWTTILISLLFVLFTIQVLLLPVNHGVLVVDKVFPRVKDLGGAEKLSENQLAWLVWEGTDGVTYLVEDRGRWDESTQKWLRVRSLITLPKKDVKRTEVIANDSIGKLLTDSVESPAWH